MIGPDRARIDRIGPKAGFFFFFGQNQVDRPPQRKHFA